MRPRGRLRTLAAAASILALAGAAIAAWAGGGGGGAAASEPEAPVPIELPAPTRSALVIPDPVPLPDQSNHATWAPVLRSVTATARPDADAPPVAPLERETPEGTSNLVLVIGRTVDGDGRAWVRARLPVLPTGAVGWLPRDAVGAYTAVDTRLVVDLTAETLTFTEGGREVMRVPVGVGTADAPTPAGEFYVRNKLTRYRSPAYGPVAFGTSARSPTLTDWPAGGYIGIHGTDRPEILPGRVSHGCIRMRNDDILRLAARLPVGTPLTIV